MPLEGLIERITVTCKDCNYMDSVAGRLNRKDVRFYRGMAQEHSTERLHDVNVEITYTNIVTETVTPNDFHYQSQYKSKEQP